MRGKRVMPVQDCHLRYLRAAIDLSRMQVNNAISPLDVMRWLNANRVSFVLVGLYGRVGWMKEPRATVDLDFVIAQAPCKGGPILARSVSETDVADSQLRDFSARPGNRVGRESA